ncbi:hypothetical protein CEP52_011493 [Fusarium oligoseptatum]|uniref:Uncharacterized protein n=1 Tax=Fusarium oligoseptatum TaxID=2604345 RepID=A0A428T358_9HYPO|nr:hypothetical protein CEP52_011493 [Fusarium oligoseptatum]
MGIYPGVRGLLFRLLQAVASNSGGEAMDKFTLDAQQRVTQEMAQVGNDFFSRLSKMCRNDPDNYSEWGVMNTCRDNVGAGSDTTGISLTAILYHIYRDLAVIARMREEID